MIFIVQGTLEKWIMISELSPPVRNKTNKHTFRSVPILVEIVYMGFEKRTKMLKVDARQTCGLKVVIYQKRSLESLAQLS